MNFRKFFLFLALLPVLSAACPAGEPEPLGASLLIHGETLFLAAPDKGKIYAFDLKDPANPRQTAFFQTGAQPCALDIEGTRLYAVDTRELLVFDIADPGKLTPVSRKNLAGHPLDGPTDVAVSKGNIWLARRRSGVMINFDPGISMYTRTLALSDGRLFAAGPFGIVTEKNGNGDLMLPLPEGTPLKIDFNGPNLYAALGYHGLGVIRDAANLYSDPENSPDPKFRRTIWHENGSWSWQDDVPLPVSAPGPLGNFSFPDSLVLDMAFDALPARHVFLAAGTSGVVTADVSDLSAIRYAAACEGLLRHNCIGLVMYGGHLYIYERGFGLRIADARDPLNLKLIGQGLPLR